MQFELRGPTFDEVRRQARRARRRRRGAHHGTEFRSPSVQLRVTPLGKVELLSTHDQMLGGPSGQRYLGCRFPADSEYARAITREAAKVGARLAKEGVIGRFALDFVVVRRRRRASGSRTRSRSTSARAAPPTRSSRCSSSPTARTTRDRDLHDAARQGEVLRGQRPPRVADYLRGLTPDDLFDIVARHGLHFDQARQTGVVFHMISCITEHGRVGLTAVGDTPAQADEIYRRAERILLDEASAALQEPPLPQTEATTVDRKGHAGRG